LAGLSRSMEAPTARNRSALRKAQVQLVHGKLGLVLIRRSTCQILILTTGTIKSATQFGNPAEESKSSDTCAVAADTTLTVSSAPSFRSTLLIDIDTMIAKADQVYDHTGRGDGAYTVGMADFDFDLPTVNPIVGCGATCGQTTYPDPTPADEPLMPVPESF
jgi:hypothetical protein